MLVVGLTGGVASGKSTVAEHFSALGAAVIDTDVIAREVVEPGEEGLQRLTQSLDPGILDNNGRLDRRALRERIFKDADTRKQVEEILHPLIKERSHQQIAAAADQAPYAILVVPLLIETDFRQYVDRILVVDAPEALQKQRLQARDEVSDEQAQAMIAAQSSRQQRLAAADDVLVNNGDQHSLKPRVAALHQRYLALATEHGAIVTGPALRDNGELASSPTKDLSPMTMADTQPELAVYEQPLNERIRTLLRLEFLFTQAQVGLERDSEWHSRLVIDTLLEIMSLLARGDLRTELIKELDRLASSLQRLDGAANVAQDRLHETLAHCRRLLAELQAVPGHAASQLKADELLNSIMQRNSVVAGTCAFDMPAYQHWLLRPAEKRRQQLREWVNAFAYLHEAGALILTVLRDSAVQEPAKAPDGLYQRTLKGGVAYQLIRVELPLDSPYFPEISGSKHFVNIRFVTQPDTRERPAQTNEEVEFKLSCCAL